MSTRALNLVYHHNVDQRMVRLEQFERLRRSGRRARTYDCGDVLAVPEAADAPVPQSGGDGIAAWNGEGSRFAVGRSATIDAIKNVTQP